MGPLKILTWAAHEDYLRSLAHMPHELIVVSSRHGRSGHGDYPRNVRVIPPDEARRQKIDLILFQRPTDYLDEQYEILTALQRRAPKIYLEHEPPRQHPVESRHVVSETSVPVVHVSHFNRLMWDHGRTPARVIEPGVDVPAARYSGELESGIAVAEHLNHGRALGIDLFEEVKRRAALDLAYKLEPQAAARYRFYFFPARYLSPTYSLIRAMMIGLPVLAPATGSLDGVVRQGIDGFVEADPERLAERMRELCADRPRATALGQAAREQALSRFGIARFIDSWNRLFAEVLEPTARRAA